MQHLRPRGLLMPSVAEHRQRQLYQCRRGFDIGKQLLELSFDHILADRLAGARAILVEAGVVRVLLSRLALRPAGREWFAAVRAQDEAAQREILADIGPHGQLGTFSKPRLYALESVQRDQRFVLSGAQRHAPFGPLQMARIQDAGEDAVHVLVGDRAETRLRELREALEKALHFGLGLEPPGGVAFKTFLNNGSKRLVAQEHLALPLAGFVAVAWRATEGPKSVEQSGALAVMDLLGILLPLML